MLSFTSPVVSLLTLFLSLRPLSHFFCLSLYLHLLETTGTQRGQIFQREAEAPVELLFYRLLTVTTARDVSVDVASVLTSQQAAKITKTHTDI